MSDPFWIAVFAAIPPTIAALAGLRRSAKNGKELSDIRLTINGRLTELLEATAGRSRAEGRTEGRSEKPRNGEHDYR